VILPQRAWLVKLGSGEEGGKGFGQKVLSVTRYASRNLRRLFGNSDLATIFQSNLPMQCLKVGVTEGLWGTVSKQKEAHLQLRERLNHVNQEPAHSSPAAG
jgi:hypothetical protein